MEGKRVRRARKRRFRFFALSRKSALAISIVSILLFFPSLSPATSPVSCSPSGLLAQIQMVHEQADYILSSQTGTGAIKLAPDSRDIIPYFSNIAAVGLIRAYRLTGDPAYLQAARRWLDWYSARQNREIDRYGIKGTIYNFKILDDGSEVPTYDYDSSDAYAATYLWALYEYFLASNDLSYLMQRKENIDLAVNAILSTMDRDNLTYARPGFRIKYLMDNCEVYRGLYSAGRMLSALGDDSGVKLVEKAEAVRRSILSTFLRGRGYFAWALSATVNLSNLYPDLMANFWPVIMGVVDGNSSVAQKLFEILKSYNYWDLSVSESSAAMSSAYFSYLVGRSNVTQLLLTRAAALYPRNEWPWHVAEAAWTILSFYHFGVDGGLVVSSSEVEESRGRVSLSLALGGYSNGTVRIFVPINSKGIEVAYNGVRLEEAGRARLVSFGLDRYLEILNVGPGDRVTVLLLLDLTDSSTGTPRRPSVEESLPSDSSTGELAKRLLDPKVLFELVALASLLLALFAIKRRRARTNRLSGSSSGG